MTKQDKIFITVGSTELMVVGHCHSCCMEIREIYLGKTDIYDLLLDLENFYNLDMEKIQEEVNIECEDYNERIYSPENQV